MGCAPGGIAPPEEPTGVAASPRAQVREVVKEKPLVAGTTLQPPAFALHGATQRLDLVAKDGTAIQHHLEAVVVLGVVAAGDLDAALAQRAGRKVQHGRGAGANVDHVQARLGQPELECRYQRRSRQPTVAPHRDRGLALGTRRRSKGPAQTACQRLVHGGGHDAADVIGLENGGSHLHGRNLHKKSVNRAGIVGMALAHTPCASGSGVALAHVRKRLAGD